MFEMENDLTLSAQKFVQLFDFVEQVGIEAQELADLANLSLRNIRQMDANRQLPALLYAKLYGQAVIKMQELQQPIPWAAGIGSEAFEFMCRCILTARSMGEALRLAQRFEQLLLPITKYNMRLQEGDSSDLVKLSYRVRIDEDSALLAPESWMHTSQQMTIAYATGLYVWHGLCGWLTGRHLEVKEVKVQAPCADQVYSQRLSNAFQCPVRFDAGENSFVFDKKELDRMVIQNRDSLKDFLDSALFHLISVERQPTVTSSAIRSLLSNSLSSGCLPSYEEISEMLNMSSSSLRRRLQKEGVSYQSLKDDVRRDIAIEQLLYGDAKISSVSEYLGFADPGSFVRSFKQWTGYTPAQYQAEYRDISL